MLELRQSTNVTLKIGPFLDQSDGYTAETLLTITQADVRLSKNGGNMAQKAESTNCTHDEIGVYDCPIDTDDTDTLGRLQLFVHETGALPVWHEYMVVTQNEYDSKYSTDYKHVDMIQVEGVDATNQIRDAVVDDATRLDGSALNALAGNDPGTQLAAQTDITALNDLTSAQVRDAVVDDATRLDGSALNALAGNDPGSQLAAQSDVTALNDLSAAQVNAEVDAALDTAIPASPTADSLNQRVQAVDVLTEASGAGDLAAMTTDLSNMRGAGFVTGTDSQEAIRDRGDAAWITGGGGGDATAANQTTMITHLTDIKGSGFTGTVDALTAVGKTGADGDTLETLSDQIDGIGGGAGAITFTYTLTSSLDGTPIGDADVWVTSDLAGAFNIASGRTNQNGVVTFYLDAGTVYVWRQKTGWDFTNPDTEVVA